MDWNPLLLGFCLAASIAGVIPWRGRFRFSACCLAAAPVLLWLTLASPLNALATEDLFSAHMLQHLLLLLGVPLLFLLGLPAMADSETSESRSGFRLPPLLAWFAGILAMAIWHEPSLCDAAARNPAVRAVQIVSLLFMGTLFWWPLFGPRKQDRLAPLTSVVYLFTACLGCSVLGILIAFAPVGAVCGAYLDPPDSWGILPLIRQGWGLVPKVDQQVGGLLMWVPGCGLYLVLVIAMLARWYRAEESKSKQHL